MGAQPERSLDTGARAGDWIVGEPLGRGGIGVVYAATHTTTSERGALKVAHEEGGVVRAHWFRRERDLVARLRHPSIVALLDAGELDNQQPFLVYERVEGGSLEALAGELTLPQIVAVGSQLLDALGYAHDAGVVHCDVTPANVLITWEGDAVIAKLTDFGLARAKADGHKRRMGGTMRVSGTPGYLSPEQAKGVGSPGPSSDLFSCGAVLFRLLTGYPPYGGETAVEIVRHTMSGTPLPLRPRVGLRAPVRLAQVVQRLLARDPEDRYPCAARARKAWQVASITRTPISGTVRPHIPATPGLQSLETIMVDNVRASDSDPQFSTMRETPAAGLLRDGLPWRRSRATELIGREAELGALLGALPPGGAAPSIVAITGAAGVGKTALLDTLRRRLRGEGVRVHSAHGRSGSPSPPMEVLAALGLHAIGAALVWPARLAAERLAAALRGLPLTDPEGTLDALIGGLLGVGPRGGGPSAIMEAFDGFEPLLKVDHQPLVLMVDDAAGLDSGTWEVLCAVARRHPGHVGVVWCGEGPPPDGLATIVEIDRPDPDVLDAIWRTHAPEGLMRDPELDLPADVATLARLTARGCPASFAGFTRELSHGARTVLEVAATYGGDIPKRALSKVALLLGAPAGSGADGVEKLLSLGALVEMPEPAARMERWLRLESPGLCAAAKDGMAPEWRKHVAAVCAQWLARECLDDNASNRARVARLAEDAGLRRSAAHARADAGRLELESGRPDGAEPHLVRAMVLASDGDAIDRPRVLAQLAEVALEIGKPLEIDAHAEEALMILEPGRDLLRARLLRLRAEGLILQADFESAIGPLRAALEILGDDGDPVETSRALATLGWVLGYRLGRNDEGIALGRRALEVAARIHAPAFRASLSGKLGANYLRAGDWDGQLETNREDLRLSSQARDPRGIVRANINLGVCFHNRGMLDRARDHTERALDLATRCGADGAAQIAHNNLAMISLDQDRRDDVVHHVTSMLTSSERTGDRRAVAETLLTRARLALRQGALDEAEARLAAAEAAGAVADLEMAQRARAWLEVARGWNEAAGERMERVCAQHEHDPYERALSRITLAGVLRSLGRVDEAEAAEAEADRVFADLGADPALERRRWGRA